MDDSYLLEQLVIKGRALRKAQDDYQACKADPRIDPIKKAHWMEKQRREQDFDRLLMTIQKAHPVPVED